MVNKKIYIYLKNKTLIDIFNEINHVIEEKFNIELETFDELLKTQQRCSLICDSTSLKEISKNDEIDINCYLIDTKNEKNNSIENNFNIAVFKTPLNVTDFFTYIYNDQISLENEIKGLYKFNYFNYDNKNRRIFNLDKNLKFTEKENEIFSFLLEASKINISVTKQMMLENVWNYHAEIDTHTLETHIYLIRKKIEDSLSITESILYEEGIGYRLVTENF